jgi:hypothetical protein
MTLIAAWKKANGQAVRAVDPEPQTRMDTGEVERVSDETAALATLQAVIDDPKALHSDRIRAVEAQQRILQRVAAEQAEEKHGALVALRQALDALPPGERVPALQGLLRLTPSERSEHPSPPQQLVSHEPVSG